MNSALLTELTSLLTLFGLFICNLYYYTVLVFDINVNLIVKIANTVITELKMLSVL